MTRPEVRTFTSKLTDDARRAESSFSVQTLRYRHSHDTHMPLNSRDGSVTTFMCDLKCAYTIVNIVTCNSNETKLALTD